MKKYCIIFKRELEDTDVIHVDTDEELTRDDAIKIIQSRGYNFDPNYDRLVSVNEV